MTTRVVDGLRVASPCPAAWSEMKGDDRVRFRGLCRKSVYNIAAMDAAEIGDLIDRTGGDFCAQLRIRKDGTVITCDCPVGARAAARRLWRRAATWLVLALAPLGSWAALRGSSRRPIPPPPGPNVSFEDWKDWACDALGLTRSDCVPLGGAVAPSSRNWVRRRAIVLDLGGAVAVPIPPSPSPSPQGPTPDGP